MGCYRFSDAFPKPLATKYSEGSNSFALGTEHNNLTNKESSGVIVLDVY
jgi:hypothetical protein